LNYLFVLIAGELGHRRVEAVVELLQHARADLDQASANFDHELAGEPVLLAQAHLTIGQAYAGLREAQPAISHLRAALEIDRRVYGEENLVTARVKAALGSALVALQRRYNEAEPLLRQALMVERRQPRPKKPSIAGLVDHLPSRV
jgi:tetratricopeptide (TPR) repeat protein